jgi:hypothetical protein
VRKGEIPLFAAAVEILGRHALVADEPAALVVAEPYAGLVVDEHEVPCQIGKPGWAARSAIHTCSPPCSFSA